MTWDFVKIYNVYDKWKTNQYLDEGYGFSCLISVGNRKILFDCGASGDKLINNLRKLKINPKSIDAVFISHKHWDHICGLFDFLNKNNNCLVVLPKDVSKEFQNEVKSYGPKVFIANKKRKIFDNIFTTGSINNSVCEQAIVISTKRGLVVVVGCAHPKILLMVNNISKMFEKQIYAIIGGFHLKNISAKEIKSIAGRLYNKKISMVAPCHCSGKNAKIIFSKVFKDKCLSVKLGDKIII